METRFLETFLLVAEHGSLAEAARRLGLTPAAIAQRMQALEDEFGVPLLSRTGRAVQPTPAGHAIIEQARRVISDIRHLRSLATIDAPSGELRIGAISTALTGLLPRALRKLVDEVPQVEVFILPGTSAQLFNALNENHIDAALLVRPPFEMPKTIEWQTLRAEPLMLLAPADLAHEDPLTLLATKPFIRYDRNNWGGRLAEKWLQSHDIRPREWLELDQLEAIAVMVSNGLGVSILPDWAPPWPAGVDAVRLPLPGGPIFREIGIITPRNASARRLVQLLIDALREGVKESDNKPEI